MVMLCVTGLVILFPFAAMEYIPYAYVHLATIIHTDEALLVTLFIFIVHWWNVHYSPEVFPMSKAWITGNLSEEQMKHEPACMKKSCDRCGRKVVMNPERITL